jgi:hypothetical protein
MISKRIVAILYSAAAGLLLAVLYAASPLTIWLVAALPLVFVLAGRGLPLMERRWVFVVLGVALLARAALIVAAFILAIPQLNDMSVGGLAGDQAYNLERALRTRDILLGFAHTRYDYFVALDEYGRSLYLSLITWLQIALGPSPYSLRLLNAVWFVMAAAALFRTARNAFGPVPAFVGLAILLGLPSLLVSSTTVLKESLFFLASVTAFVVSVRALRSWRPRDVIVAIAVLGVCLWVLNDLRRMAAVLTVAGIGLGLLLNIVTRRQWLTTATAALLVAALALVVLQPALRERALSAVMFMAKTHAGNVFTVGHAYKLMDEGFYVTPTFAMTWNMEITEAQAARYLIRAATSFFVTPLPWEMASRAELAFLPEHMMWYVLAALFPVGVVAGWKRDPLLTSMLIGYLAPTAAVVALTNGNVGTLLRMRGLVTPYMVWLSVLGLVVIVDALIRRRRQSARSVSAGFALEGPAV